jgi:hypothetical protein
MRSIVFRGKRVDNGEWVEGSLFSSILGASHGRAYIEYYEPILGLYRFEIDPATVGQFTGLCDKNGKRIFEGDMLSAYEYRFVVKFGLHGALNGWYVEYGNGETAELNESWSWKPYGGEVIGNIHDQPEAWR